MTAGELVLSVERHWGKTLDAEQRAKYLSKMARFAPDQLDAIFDLVLEQSRYFPKIAELYDVAKDAGFLNHSREQKTVGKRGCPTCKGTGFRYITEAVTMPDGVTFESGQAVRVCECRTRGKTRTAGGVRPSSTRSSLYRAWN